MPGIAQRKARLRGAALGIAASWFSLGAGAIGAGETVTYDLLPGSRILEECTECDGPPIERDLTGYLQLEPADSLPGATTYRISSLQFTSHHFEYVVRGEGEYRRLVTWPATHDMELRVSINSVGGIILRNDPVEITEKWPVIEIEVRETEARDPSHVYTLRLLAAPQPIAWTRYELREGSTLVDECTCGRPPVIVDLQGHFFLGEIESGANPIATSVVAGLSLQSASNGLPYLVDGGGVYRQGGEVALLQEGRLTLQINDLSGVMVSSEPAPPPVVWPAMDMTLSTVLPTEGLFYFTLRLVAEPAAPPEASFRRGDTNADGAFNIADAVNTLDHLFGNSRELPCFKAADVNDDGQVDIADPIAALSYIFGASGPLADPFEQCGYDPTIDGLSCDTFPPCPPTR